MKQGRPLRIGDWDYHEFGECASEGDEKCAFCGGVVSGKPHYFNAFRSDDGCFCCVALGCYMMAGLESNED